MSLLDDTSAVPNAPAAPAATPATARRQPAQLGIRAAALAGVFVSADVMALGFSGAFDGALGVAYTTAA